MTVLKEQTLYSKGLMALRILLGVFFISTFVCYWYVNRQDGYDKQYITYAAELRVLIERFTRHAGEAVVEAKKVAFTYLKYRTNEFSVILDILKRGRQDSAGKFILPPSTAQIQNKELADLSRIWVVQKANAELILNNQDLILGLHDTVNTLSASLQKIQTNYIDIINILGKRKNISGEDYADLAQQIVNAEDIEQNIRQVLDVNTDNTEIERQFSLKTEAFGKKLNELKARYGNDIVYSKFIEIEKNYVIVKDRSSDIIKTAQTLDKINSAWLSIYNMIPTFLEYTTNLEKAYANATGRYITDTTAVILSTITFLLLIMLLYMMYKENENLQMEIKQLVHELKDLGNGNLAVKATAVTGVTMAIAEAINYALNALRKLVTSINQTSKKVSGSALDVKKVAGDLLQAINHQTEEITNAAASANVMASSIDLVAKNAKESARVAENSVVMAHEGAIVVNNTIAGMERIREQIKKTETKIRRLGESSQEIGEIVSLINGISEQTNLLSLNASIQAAMAGDVGLGFAVVADEVQQLAVKSQQATKEVESIVKGIQNDTHHAVESMELAISEVAVGTGLAHDAGRALSKIETVSNNLAELIQAISAAAAEQALVATKISNMIGIIESIAEQTAIGTHTTAESIGNLAALVQELRSSVAEFKLPEVQYGER
jgi:twitching motility protein PilJ